MTSISDTGGQAHTFTDADWGTDLDFYISSILFWVYTDVAHDFFAETDDYIEIYIANAASPYEFFFAKTYTGGLYTAGQLDDDTHKFARSEFFPQLRRVLSTEDIEISMTNYTGASINAQFFINGIPK